MAWGTHGFKIQIASLNDLIRASKSLDFSLEWEFEQHYDTFKILHPDEAGPLGFISMFQDASRSFITVNQIEVSQSCRGPNRKYSTLAGCLLAFAVRRAFDGGMKGRLVLEPKNERLMTHYVEAYGFEHSGYSVHIEEEAARKLFLTYWDGNEDE